MVILLLRMLRDGDSNEWITPVELQTEARHTIENQQEITKASYDKKRSKSLTFGIGEVVVMR